MDISLLLKYFADKDTLRCGWRQEYIDTSFETLPSEFIGFAEIDLQSTFEHKYINALSNAKRALDCQVDRLLKLLGYYKEASQKFWSVPRKLEIIQKFEIIAPRVLNKINKTRNLMEHQYIKPNSTQVEDFLDIVSLFVASTDHYATNSSCTVDYLNEVNSDFDSIYPEVSFTIDSINEKIIIERHLFDSLNTKAQIEVKRGDPEYIDIFKNHLKKVEFH